MNIKGTQTEKNLHAALSGESMARNKYTYYAMTAREEGYPEIADALERMAKNEMMHAKFWFEALYGDPKRTAENLMDAAGGEFAEWHSMYPKFAAEARKDGLEDLAIMFERVATIEKDHERQFMLLLAEMNGAKPKVADDAIPKKAEQKVIKDGYRCMFCGAVYETRPDTCSMCKSIGSFEPCTYEA